MEASACSSLGTHVLISLNSKINRLFFDSKYFQYNTHALHLLYNYVHCRFIGVFVHERYLHVHTQEDGRLILETIFFLFKL